MTTGKRPGAIAPSLAGKYRSAARRTPSRIGTSTSFCTTTSYSIQEPRAFAMISLLRAVRPKRRSKQRPYGFHPLGAPAEHGRIVTRKWPCRSAASLAAGSVEP